MLRLLLVPTALLATAAPAIAPTIYFDIWVEFGHFEFLDPVDGFFSRAGEPRIDLNGVTVSTCHGAINVIHGDCDDSVYRTMSTLNPTLDLSFWDRDDLEEGDQVDINFEADSEVFITVEIGTDTWDSNHPFCQDVPFGEYCVLEGPEGEDLPGGLLVVRIVEA